MTEEKDFQSFWSVLPTALLEDTKLPLRAKKLYGLISSLCKKEGYCWATNNFLSEKTKIPLGTLRKYLKKLEEEKWIKCDIEENYKRRIFLRMPDFYKKYREGLSKSGQGGLPTAMTNEEQGVAHSCEQKRTTYNNKDSNNNMSANADEKEFSFKEKLELMEKDPKRHIQIICLYWKFKKFMVENKEQYQTLIKRDLKSATRLVGFSNEQILEIMEYLENENTFKWTLESILKYIGERLDRIKPIK